MLKVTFRGSPFCGPATVAHPENEGAGMRFRGSRLHRREVVGGRQQADLAVLDLQRLLAHRVRHAEAEHVPSILQGRKIAHQKSTPQKNYIGLSVAFTNGFPVTFSNIISLFVALCEGLTLFQWMFSGIFQGLFTFVISGV